MKLTVFGTGYLGATHAACMAELGHDVLGVDVDPAKVEALNAGIAPFHEKGLDDLLERNIAAGRLRFTTSYAEAAAHGAVHFIGVGTPQRKGSYRADTRFVESVVDELVPLLAGDHLIVGKSTVPVGTAVALQERINELGYREDVAEQNVEVCWNPEFLREGRAVRDTLAPDRIVVGIAEPGTSSAQKVEDAMREVYAGCIDPVDPQQAPSPFVLVDLPTAELVKVSANAFLATKISFINAVSEVCEASGADITQLATAIGMDERIGRKFLHAGLGFGGGCLPKDIRAFMARAGELGADQALTFLREVDSINMRRREKLVNLTRKACGGDVLGHRVTVLGATFKPESDDVRDSPALNVAGSLSLAGAQVRVYDPMGNENARRLFPTLDYADNVEEALTDAEVVIVATEWKEFRELDPVAAREFVARPIVLDGRNCLPAEKWVAAGWSYRGLGRSVGRGMPRAAGQDALATGSVGVGNEAGLYS
ncbi:MAG TPA: UDP-glucose/GDP-mannose dehydrogenase family protein [Candidatus Corynebacterium avicola]|uniref:UDP-glucose 6-dehydrogenase n=1 Tax=Candidatus Corynebacterium avicola TaxID=2838527 RepID=A0A9D1RT22_9CORY|nr:UDP-glucose/GDP-mannose dehydrogenase family protein [Candidatus Corynebacterium avicola]